METQVAIDCSSGNNLSDLTEYGVINSFTQLLMVILAPLMKVQIYVITPALLKRFIVLQLCSNLL